MEESVYDETKMKIERKKSVLCLYRDAHVACVLSKRIKKENDRVNP